MNAVIALGEQAGRRIVLTAEVTSRGATPSWFDKLTMRATVAASGEVPIVWRAFGGCRYGLDRAADATLGGRRRSAEGAADAAEVLVLSLSKDEDRAIQLRREKT